MSRRQLLFAGAATGGGFLIGWRREAGPRVLAAADKAMPAAFAPNAFIRIGRDGRVTLIICQVEMGQGTYTSMSMLLAEELEVGLDQVRSSTRRPTTTSTRTNFSRSGDGLLVVRARVRRAAAPRRRDRADDARDRGSPGVEGRSGFVPGARGVVTHTPTGRKLTYGVLADRAAKLPVPTQVTLRDRRTSS